jgi:hypothetical protein
MDVATIAGQRTRMDWIVAQLRKQLLFLEYSFYYFFFPSKIARFRGTGRNAALNHFKSGVILSFLITGIFVPLPDSDALKLLIMFGWIVFNYIGIVASSYVTEYFLQTSGGDTHNNSTLIAYSYSAGSSVPLFVGVNCIYISLIDTPTFPFDNVTFLGKLAVLSVGYTSPLARFYPFSSTIFLGYEVINCVVSVSSVTTLIVLLAKLANVSIARSGVCILSTSYAIQIFVMFLLGHTLS